MCCIWCRSLFGGNLSNIAIGCWLELAGYLQVDVEAFSIFQVTP